MSRTVELLPLPGEEKFSIGLSQGAKILGVFVTLQQVPDSAIIRSVVPKMQTVEAPCLLVEVDKTKRASDSTLVYHFAQVPFGKPIPDGYEYVCTFSLDNRRIAFNLYATAEVIENKDSKS